MGFWSFANDLGNTILNSLDPLNIFGGVTGNSQFSKDTGSGSLLADTWDKFKNGNANDVNYAIAQQNLEYQKQRNAIEDARYSDETSYNRAFAENQRDYERSFAAEEQNYQRSLDEFQKQFALDEREYNRALQERLFEREDTALERQAQGLSNLGINPLSQNLNGLNAGQVISSSAPSFEGASYPGSASAPGLSSRGGRALNNQFSAFPGGLDGVMSIVSSLGDTLNGMATGQYQRDALQLENERKALENYVYAKSHGVHYPAPKTAHFLFDQDGWDGYDNEYWHMLESSAEFNDINNKREFQGKKAYDLYDFESPESKLIKSLGNMDFVGLAENILTKGAKVVDNIGSKFNKDFGTESLLMKFFSLFY